MRARPHRSWGGRRRLQAVAALTAILVLSCGNQLEEVPPPTGRVLLIALDGATWDRIDPLIAQGRMPNFAKLTERGARGVLTSMIGVSPTLFTTIATGKTPEQHGILRFVKEGNVPFTNEDRKTRALWNVVSERGGTVNVVGWFTTWPADEVNGAFISDRCEGVLPGGVFPHQLSTLLESTSRALPREDARRMAQRLYGPVLPPGEVSADVQRDYVNLENEILDYFRTDVLRLEWAENLLRTRPAHLNAVFFKGIDPLSHQAWIFSQPEEFLPIDRPKTGAIARYGDAIDRYYVFIDEAIGRLIAAAPPDTDVVIVSDHGFGPKKDATSGPVYRLNPLLARAGFIVTDAAGHPDEERSLLFDPTPHWQEWRTDRKLRLSPRLPEGQDPSAIAARLRALSTPGGVPIFSQVEPSDPEGIAVVLEPRLAQLQDRGDGAGIVRRKLGHSGGHRFEGVVLLAGPHVRPGARLNKADLYDVAPTALRLLRLPQARDMRGHVLESALLLDALGPDARPVKSYETTAAIRRVESAPMPKPLDDEFRDRLRSLGYIQ